MKFVRKENKDMAAEVGLPVRGEKALPMKKAKAHVAAGTSILVLGENYPYLFIL